MQNIEKTHPLSKVTPINIQMSMSEFEVLVYLILVLSFIIYLI